jgi:hypothetical protein
MTLMDIASFYGNAALLSESRRRVALGCEALRCFHRSGATYENTVDNRAWE